MNDVYVGKAKDKNVTSIPMNQDERPKGLFSFARGAASASQKWGYLQACGQLSVGVSREPAAKTPPAATYGQDHTTAAKTPPAATYSQDLTTAAKTPATAGQAVICGKW